MLTWALSLFITQRSYGAKNSDDVVVAVAAGGGSERLGPAGPRTMLAQVRAVLETGWLAGEAVWCERCCCSCTVPTGLADLSSTPAQGRQREDWRRRSLVRASWSVIKPRRGGMPVGAVK
jgi:hypothetical protein